MLKVNSINFYYDNNLILDEINLEFLPSHIYGIIGVNGAGKSTLVKCLGNQLYPNSGSIEYNGVNIYNNLDYISKSFLLDNDFYLATFTPLTLLNKLSKNNGLKIDYEVFYKMIKDYNIDRDKLISKLSKGNQRVAYLIVVLSLKPSVIILDEFLDGIDIVNRTTIKRELLDYVQNNNAIIIVASHTTSDINDICDNIVLLDNASVKRNCKLDDLKTSYLSFQLVLTNNLNSDDFELMGLNVYNYKAFENIRWLSIANDIDQVKILESIEVIQLKQLPIKLEEVIYNEFSY